jgi:hypothetical protein
LVIKTADDLTGLLNSGCAFAATSCLLNEIRVVSNNKNGENTVICSMGERRIDSDIEDDPEWLQAMEYRKLVAKVLSRAGPLWRAAMVLSLSEQLAKMEDDTLAYTIEGDVVSFSPRNLWSLHAKQIINFSRHSFTNSSMNLKENREKEYFCNTIISQHRSYSWVL